MELAQMGDDMLDDAMARIGNIMSDVNAGISLADEINIELAKQEEQLIRMKKNLKDTQNTMVQAQKLIRYFGRQLYTDKIIMGLVILIILAITAIVVLYFMGYIGDSSESIEEKIKNNILNQDKNQTTTAS